ncbi:hypothetical protein ONZ51_g6263 [Trametes cubensis]|uniref:Uncharacterized protein n=1 Tax=Trametes cubensis TaxID=1111947 RepID=A0AAD7XCV0_9APHY|nr:hypothetical protein ONZ51_g6263 [Trametes cubensis]
MSPSSSSSISHPSTQSSFSIAKSSRRPRITQALAVQLDEDCIKRWSELFYEEYHPGRREQLPPEVYRESIKSLTPFTMDYIGHRVYKRFPNLPRLHRPGFLVTHPDVMWLFAFKDNSSEEILNAPLTAEDVKAVKEFLGVKKQGAKWYDVRTRVR